MVSIPVATFPTSPPTFSCPVIFDVESNDTPDIVKSLFKYPVIEPTLFKVIELFSNPINLIFLTSTPAFNFVKIPFPLIFNPLIFLLFPSIVPENSGITGKLSFHSLLLMSISFITL